MRSKRSMKKSWRSPLSLLCLSCLIFSSLHVPAYSKQSSGRHRSIVSRRGLLSFKETPKGGNTSYDCSPSGACVPCLYSEKKDEKYRCSETGYRIPMKCLEMGDGKVVSGNKSQKGRLAMETLHKKVKGLDMLHEDAERTKLTSGRALLDDSSRSENGHREYITYRSCITPVNEEKLSVIGFEVILLGLLLASGPFIYLRKKRAVTTMPGVAAARIPTSSHGHGLDRADSGPELAGPGLWQLELEPARPRAGSIRVGTGRAGSGGGTTGSGNLAGIRPK